MTTAVSAITQLMVMGCTNDTITYRTEGHQTVCLESPSHGEQVLVGFNPAIGDRIGLDDILELTQAKTDLSDLTKYVTSVSSGGNTTLYFDPTGSGAVGTPIALLVGVTTTIAQLIADGGVAYVPDAITTSPTFDTAFTFRDSGLETVRVAPAANGIATQQFDNFNPNNGDILDLSTILHRTTALSNLSNLQNFVTATSTGGNTVLSFDKTGSGVIGTPFAVLEGITITLAQLQADNALIYNPSPVVSGTAPTTVDGQLMVMGCTNDIITYRASGHQTVCLQSPSHGEQVLHNFNPAIGDLIGLDDVLELTQAKTDLSDLTKYITSVASGGNTTLYFDPTGSGHAGTPVALLVGVTTTIAQLIADGGVAYVPDAITVSPTFDTAFMFRDAGLETLTLAPAARAIATQQVDNFNPAKADILDLTRILNPTTAAPNLSNVQDYITATETGGNTVLSVDPTGSGAVGTPFAVLEGVTITLAQLLSDGAMAFSPTNATIGAAAGTSATFRPEGKEVIVLGGHVPTGTLTSLANFSLTDQDQIDFRLLFANYGISATLGTIADYISTTASASSTIFDFHQNGADSPGVAIAVLQNVSVTFASLLSHGSISLA